MNYRWGLVYINLWRTMPTYYMLMRSRFAEKANQDLDVWTKNNPQIKTRFRMLAYGFCMMDTKEYRNVVLNRLHRNPVRYLVTRMLFKPLDSL